MALYQVEGTALTRRSLRVETPAQDRIPHRPAAQTGNESLLAAHSRGGPIESRAAEFEDLIVIVIAVAAALLLDLLLFTWMASH